MGRVITPEEYRKYWDGHPKHLEQEMNFSKLSTEQKHTEQILDKGTVGSNEQNCIAF